MHFNWGDIDLTENFEIVSKNSVYDYDTDQMAFLRISLYEDEASSRKALIQGRKKFIEVCGYKPNFRKVSVIEKKDIILFTTRQIEYTIEVVADEASIACYYDNI